ncbi:MAG: hypothetical protein D6715_09315 [Calditrichaeota bacterium]|nr:MAG: hypothetical protein D6715_09315 [Calditrichota bacterium]
MIDVVFIAQSGELEIMAALLAASIRKHGPEDVTLHVIEPSPPEVYGSVSPRVRDFLERMNARWYTFPNPISDDFKIFNKLNAFRIQAEHSHILFLDSDTLVRKPLRTLEPFLSYPFAIKAANKQRFSVRDPDWAAVYGALNLEVPRLRLPAWDSGEWAPPYLNAGVILAQADLNFSQTWIEVTRRLHFDSSLPSANRNTVQISLPVALARQGISFALLDNRFNFCLSKGWLARRPPWPEDQVAIVHYFRPKGLLAEPVFARELCDLVAEFELENILAQSPTWGKVLRRAHKQFQSGTRTKGLPQSTLFRPEAPAAARFSGGTAPRIAGSFPGITEEDLQAFQGLALPAQLNGSRVALPEPVSGAEIGREVPDLLSWPEPLRPWLAFIRKIETMETSGMALAVILHPLLAVARWKESDLWDWLLRLPLQDETGAIGSCWEEFCIGLGRLAALREPVQRAAGLWNLLVSPVLARLNRIAVLTVDAWHSKPAKAGLPGEQITPAVADGKPTRQQGGFSGFQPEEMEWVRAICSAHAAPLGFELYQLNQPIFARED